MALLSADGTSPGVELNKTVDRVVMLRLSVIPVTCLDGWWCFGVEFPIAEFFGREEGAWDEGGRRSGG